MRKTWSRGRELNPRPTDYEARAAEMPPSQSFYSLPRIVLIWLTLPAVTRSNHQLQELQETSRDQAISAPSWRKRAQAAAASPGQRGANGRHAVRHGRSEGRCRTVDVPAPGRSAPL